MIPAEAVKVAAKAIYECQPLHGFPSGEVISWDELTAGAFAKRGLMLQQAQAALEAAAPYMQVAWEAERDLEDKADEARREWLDEKGDTK